MATKVAIKKQPNSLMKPIGIFLRRFHFIVFFVIVVSCLSAAVVLINETLTDSSDPYTSSINAGTIDRATLERIQSLHPSSQPDTAPELPQGRINPFSE